MSRIELAGVVVKVFRKCRRCQQWRSMGNFNRNLTRNGYRYARACNRCRKYVRPNEGYSGLYWITDQGRAAWRAAES